MKKSALTASLFVAQLSTAAVGQYGPGPKGRYAFNQDNVRGWQIMTPEERTAHQEKMWSFKTCEECKASQEQHHKQMEARAKEQGKTLVAPRYNACDQMKAQGLFE